MAVQIIPEQYINPSFLDARLFFTLTVSATNKYSLPIYLTLLSHRLCVALRLANTSRSTGSSARLQQCCATTTPEGKGLMWTTTLLILLRGKSPIQLIGLD